MITKKQTNYQQGSAHAVLVICLVLALITTLGWIFWQNFIHKEEPQKETEVVVVEKEKETEKAEETEKEVKPATDDYAVPSKHVLLAVYKKAEPSLSDKATLDNVSAKRSQTEGYMIANAAGGVSGGVGGAPISFYRTPDGEWHYTKEFQQMLSCDLTGDVRKAYIGERCETRSGSSVVR